MPLKVGPFVGVSESSARIWFRADADADYSLEVRSGQELRTERVRTSREGTGVAELSGLKPDTKYGYSLSSDAGADLLDGISEPGFRTFPEPGEDVEFSFAFFSCHKPFREKFLLKAMRKIRGHSCRNLIAEGRAPDEKALSMWRSLESRLLEGDRMTPRFLLALGDQIYADELWEDKRILDAPYDEVVACYRAFYENFLGLPEIKRVTARCPVFMTWDDHEVRDGWGSKKGDGFESPVPRAARQVYQEHQLAHNPHVDPGEGFYAFRYGKTGFIVLDLRTYRKYLSEDRGELLCDSQRSWLCDWMESEGKKCEVVFVASSVPFLHLTSHISAIPGKTAGGLLVRLLGLSDDLIDQWTSKRNQDDAVFLSELLFDYSNREGIRFVLLGGDVHVGTIAVLRSPREPDEFHPLIYQFTSSPISNKPARKTRFIKDLAPEIHLGDRIPFRGRLLRMFPERNFGIVEIRRHPKTDRYGVTFEIHCEDSGVHRFPTVW
jgi:alkaline phosphatase D